MSLIKDMLVTMKSESMNKLCVRGTHALARIVKARGVFRGREYIGSRFVLTRFGFRVHLNKGERDKISVKH